MKITFLRWFRYWVFKYSIIIKFKEYSELNIKLINLPLKTQSEIKIKIIKKCRVVITIVCHVDINTVLRFMWFFFKKVFKKVSKKVLNSMKFLKMEVIDIHWNLITPVGRTVLRYLERITVKCFGKDCIQNWWAEC